MAAFGVFVLILIVVEILVLCKCSRSYKIDACLQFVAILLNLLIFQITFSNFSGLREVFFNKYSERVKKALWIVLSNLFLAPVVTQAICFLQEKNNIGLNIHLPKIVTGSYRTNFFISILAYTISIVLSVHYLKDKSNISLNVIAPVMVLISIITDQVYFISKFKYFLSHSQNEQHLETKTDYAVQVFLILISIFLGQISNIQIMEMACASEGISIQMLFEMVQILLFVMLAAVRVMSTLLSAQLVRPQHIDDSKTELQTKIDS